MNHKPFKKSLSNDGIALMSVLMVSVVLLAMAGAFFAAHKADLALMGASTNIESSKNAALSAAEFIQYKLQNDRTFGTIAFEEKDFQIEYFPSDLDEPQMVVEYIGKSRRVSNNLIRGKIHKTGLEFEAVVLNHLNSDSRGRHSRGETPARTARVWITAKHGHVVKHLDFILKRSPFTSVSMLSGGDIDVSLANSIGGNWWLGARQASGNAVRANGTISGPEVLSAKGRSVLFEPPEGLSAKVKPPYGVIQGRHLNMHLNGVATPVEAGNEYLARIKRNIKGVLSPGSAEIKVPELDASKLSKTTRTVKMPASTVSFRTRQNEGMIIHELLEDGEVAARYRGMGESSRIHTWFGSDNRPAAYFDLESKTMYVVDDTELEVDDGAFRLNSVVGTTNEPDLSNQPTLVLGTAVKGASLKATGINIEGSVGGMGALKAGDGDLQIRAKSSLSTTPDFGLALHSNKDVTLSKPGSSSKDGIPTDWDAFAEAFRRGPRGTIERLNGWANVEESSKAPLAADFSHIQLREPGEMQAGDDPLWLGLAQEYSTSANAIAKAKYDEWMQPYVPPVRGPDPDYVPADPPVQQAPNISVIGPDGDPVLLPDPDWSPTPWVDPGPPIIELEPAVPAGPGIDMTKYVKLREFLRSAVGGAEADGSWLDLEGYSPDLLRQRRVDVRDMLENQLSSYQIEAGQTSHESDGHVTLTWNGLKSYFTGANPFLSGYRADMKFRGLIYAGGRFSFDTKEQGIEVEGALVAQGNISISNATGARFIYNSALLENLFVTSEGDNSANLERSYWAFY